MNTMQKTSVGHSAGLYSPHIGGSYDFAPPPPDDIPELTELYCAEASLEPDLTAGLPALIETPAPSIVTRTAAKIVRARTGTTELRLMKELSDDVLSKYLLVTVNIAPYRTTTAELLKDSDEHPSAPQVPMTEKEAIRAFNQAVARHYPPARTRNGKRVPTHITLM